MHKEDIEKLMKKYYRMRLFNIVTTYLLLLCYWLKRWIKPEGFVLIIDNLIT
jgi:hypothetical protein